MDDKKLHFLAKAADILIKELDAYDLVKELKEVLATFIELKDLNIYVFDPRSEFHWSSPGKFRCRYR